ncbi:hypothetical protein [Curtanaerobium respiraculi]|nr:hypothetical protein [Curtanaerobium respiraculi]
MPVTSSKAVEIMRTVEGKGTEYFLWRADIATLDFNQFTPIG